MVSAKHKHLETGNYKDAKIVTSCEKVISMFLWVQVTALLKIKYKFQSQKSADSETYTLLCSSVTLVALLLFHHGYLQFAHFQKKNPNKRERVNILKLEMQF